jgi:hypothetical protein
MLDDRVDMFDGMDLDFFWDVLISGKFVPADRFSNMTQSFDLAVLYRKPTIEYEDEVKMKYTSRKWVL